MYPFISTLLLHFLVSSYLSWFVQFLSRLSHASLFRGDFQFFIRPFRPSHFFSAFDSVLGVFHSLARFLACFTGEPSQL